MKDLLDRLGDSPGGLLLPTEDPPTIRPEHTLPDDLAQFYRYCGGAELFRGADFPVSISAPSGLVPSNPVVVGEVVPDDITDSWYIVAQGGSGECISIDLHPDRLGKCYDSFYEVHGVPDSCPVIATSFTDLLERLLKANGGHWYWLEPNFESLGDAYDDVR